MKLRIQDSSLRLRLTRKEVAAFAATGRVAAETHFPSGRRLTYALEASRSEKRLAATFEDGHITVRVPEELVGPWVHTDKVGLEEHAGMSILVEKDFKCLHGPAHRVDADAFPNPNA